LPAPEGRLTRHRFPQGPEPSWQRASNNYLRARILPAVTSLNNSNQLTTDCLIRENGSSFNGPAACKRVKKFANLLSKQWKEASMFAQIEYPERKLLPGKLDEYLANGWFRMRQSIFTTNFLHFNNQFYSAIWLRVVLGVAIHDKRFKALCKLNKKFSTVIQKSVIGSVGEAHEQLYRHYRQAVSFESSPSLHELLNGSQPYNSFNTHEINVYDGDRIIAAGFFDLGNDSAAGITCIYHPDYKKHSLGKYLMYLKMDFCKQNGMRYFYPGYVVPGYPSFDYKLDIGSAALQYLQLSTNQWLPYMQSEAAPNPLMQMIERLAELQATLKNLAFPPPSFFTSSLRPTWTRFIGE
jgi:arginine-tRNA-protein transferase